MLAMFSGSLMHASNDHNNKLRTIIKSYGVKGEKDIQAYIAMLQFRELAQETPEQERENDFFKQKELEALSQRGYLVENCIRGLDKSAEFGCGLAADQILKLIYAAYKESSQKEQESIQQNPLKKEDTTINK